MTDGCGLPLAGVLLTCCQSDTVTGAEFCFANSKLGKVVADGCGLCTALVSDLDGSGV